MPQTGGLKGEMAPDKAHPCLALFCYRKEEIAMGNRNRTVGISGVGVDQLYKGSTVIFTVTLPKEEGTEEWEVEIISVVQLEPSIVRLVFRYKKESYVAMYRPFTPPAGSGFLEKR